jgi:hypothetical protein
MIQQEAVRKNRVHLTELLREVMLLDEGNSELRERVEQEVFEREEASNKISRLRGVSYDEPVSARIRASSFLNDDERSANTYATHEHESEQEMMASQQQQQILLQQQQQQKASPKATKRASMQSFLFGATSGGKSKDRGVEKKQNISNSNDESKIVNRIVEPSSSSSSSKGGAVLLKPGVAIIGGDRGQNQKVKTERGDRDDGKQQQQKQQPQLKKDHQSTPTRQTQESPFSTKGRPPQRQVPPPSSSPPPSPPLEVVLQESLAEKRDKLQTLRLLQARKKEIAIENEGLRLELGELQMGLKNEEEVGLQKETMLRKELKNLLKSRA